MSYSASANTGYLAYSDAPFDGLSEFSCGVWVYRTGNAAYDRLVSKGVDGTSSGTWALLVDDSGGSYPNYPYAEIWIGSNSFVARGAAALTLNTWVHVLMTYSSVNRRLRLYINGVLVTETAVSSGGAVNTNALALRLLNDPMTGQTTRYFHGSICDFAFWTSELSASDAYLVGTGNLVVNVSRNTLQNYAPLTTPTNDIIGGLSVSASASVTAATSSPASLVPPPWNVAASNYAIADYVSHTPWGGNSSLTYSSGTIYNLFGAANTSAEGNGGFLFYDSGGQSSQIIRWHSLNPCTFKKILFWFASDSGTPYGMRGCKSITFYWKNSAYDTTYGSWSTSTLTSANLNPLTVDVVNGQYFEMLIVRPDDWQGHGSRVAPGGGASSNIFPILEIQSGLPKLHNQFALGGGAF